MRRILRVMGFVFVLTWGFVPQAAAVDATITKLASEGDGDGAGAGDLRLTEGCRLTIYGPGYVNGDLHLEIGSAEAVPVKFDFEIGDQYDFYIYLTVPASNSNRNVECWASGNFEFTQRSWTLPGSGPGTALFKIAAFIRQNWVGQPNPYRIFGGDDRDFSSSDGASHRIQSSMDLYNPATSNDGDTIVWGPNHTAGQTLEYDRATSLTGPFPGYLSSAAKADWTWNTTLKTRWDTANVNNGDNYMSCSAQRLGPNPAAQTSGSRVSCIAGVKIPLTPQDFTPRIRWDFDVDLFWGLNKINYRADGCHTYFPNFELYVWRKHVHSSTDSGNYTDLAYGCQDTFVKEGNLQ